MRAISIMTTLVVDAENRKLFQEVEVLYADGSVRSVRIPAYKSIRLDLDSFYKEDQNESPAHKE